MVCVVAFDYKFPHSCMFNRRFSVIVANRSSGAISRFTFRGRPVAALAAVLFTVPLVFTIYLSGNIHAKIERLTLDNAQLELENSGYRSAATKLSTAMTSLQTAVTDLKVRTQMHPHVSTSVNQLPDGPRAAAGLAKGLVPSETAHTFGRLGSLLGSLEQALQAVRQGVAYREALVEATPIIWPADGWISAGYGYRSDPFTGLRSFHPAVDISTRKGQPVYATAIGRVISASRNGDYGNLVEIDHGFGLMTRYGHLADFAVANGDTVLRGDVIGSVGATGRATGYHVHYEVWASGQTVNPRRLLTDSYPIAAN